MQQNNLFCLYKFTFHYLLRTDLSDDEESSKDQEGLFYKFYLNYWKSLVLLLISLITINFNQMNLKVLFCFVFQSSQKAFLPLVTRYVA